MLLNTHPYYKELRHSEREQKRCYSEVQFGGLRMRRPRLHLADDGEVMGDGCGVAWRDFYQHLQ